MQPQQQSSRIDLVELKAQIVKRVGVEKSKKYFAVLSRFVSQKLSKSELNRSCFRLLGKENLSLHNQFICAVLRNAIQAKAPPPVNETGPAKSLVQTSPSKEDGHEQGGPPVSIWSNGVLLVSPRKVRSGARDRKVRDRMSPLGPNGKVDSVLHHKVELHDNGSDGLENGYFTPCDYQRPLHQLQVVTEQPECEMAKQIILRKSKIGTGENEEEVKEANSSSFSRSHLLAPLGIPFCSSSSGGARKATSVATSGNIVCCYDIGGLHDTEALRKRMEQIATVNGLGGVSVECASLLNSTLDVYLKGLINSCVELVGSRSHLRDRDPRTHPIHQLRNPSMVMNGMWQSNHLRAQSNRTISLPDFKVAMELNPKQLGEDWPLLLEKICTCAFEE